MPLSRQYHIPDDPIQWPGPSIEPPRQSGFHPFILIGLQQGHQRRLHHFGARDAAGMSAFLQQSCQLNVDAKGLLAMGLLPRRSMPSSGSSDRSEEHTSELQSLMRNSYAVFCLK